MSTKNSAAAAGAEYKRIAGLNGIKEQVSSSHLFASFQ